MANFESGVSTKGNDRELRLIKSQLSIFVNYFNNSSGHFDSCHKIFDESEVAASAILTKALT